MPESRAILTSIAENLVDFGGIVGAITDSSEVKAVLDPRFSALLEAEIDKMVAFAVASHFGANAMEPSQSADGPSFELAPVSARGISQPKKKGRKK